VGLGDLAPDPHPWTYMVLWVLFTFFGLGFTTAMVQSLCDPNLNFSATLRSFLPAWMTGSVTTKDLQAGAHRSETRRRAEEKIESFKKQKTMQLQLERERTKSKVMQDMLDSNQSDATSSTAPSDARPEPPKPTDFVEPGRLPQPSEAADAASGHPPKPKVQKMDLESTMAT
jgi:hypothetical protein